MRADRKRLELVGAGALYFAQRRNAAEAVSPNDVVNGAK